MVPSLDLQALPASKHGTAGPSPSGIMLEHDKLSLSGRLNSVCLDDRLVTRGAERKKGAWTARGEDAEQNDEKIRKFVLNIIEC